MDVHQLPSKVTDNLTVARVFGEPIAHGDILVVPVARIRGGAGGGSGPGPTQEGTGSAGSAGFNATPAGVFVIRSGSGPSAPAPGVPPTRVGGARAGGGR